MYEPYCVDQPFKDSGLIESTFLCNVLFLSSLWSHEKRWNGFLIISVKVNVNVYVNVIVIDVTLSTFVLENLIVRLLPRLKYEDISWYVFSLFTLIVLHRIVPILTALIIITDHKRTWFCYHYHHFHDYDDCLENYY